MQNTVRREGPSTAAVQSDETVRMMVCAYLWLPLLMSMAVKLSSAFLCKFS